MAQNRMREKTNNNIKVSDIETIFGGDAKKSIVGKVILATKKVIYNERERERERERARERERERERERDHSPLML